ncbi:MAG: response regulator [Desulfobacterales bacterium]|nr:response regulator [Desulfobacterales bacterium]
MGEMKLMLVDDEKRFLVTMEKLATRKGFRVETAGSGMEALEKLKSHRIHVVVLDACMPGMDGIATLREIKRRHPLVEVIMLTGHATVEAAIDGLKSGATDFLIKPVDIDDLLVKAEEAFLKRQALDKKIRVAQLG